MQSGAERARAGRDCVLVGFNSAAHFTRPFHREYGVARASLQGRAGAGVGEGSIGFPRVSVERMVAVCTPLMLRISAIHGHLSSQQVVLRHDETTHVSARAPSAGRLCFQ